MGNIGEEEVEDEEMTRKAKKAKKEVFNSSSTSIYFIGKERK